MSLTKQVYWEKSEEDILSNNFSNSSRKKLENLLPKRTWKSIRRKAERMSIKRIDYFKSLRPKNHHFFKKWSEEMAYILGFITADGSIIKSGYSHYLQFCLQKRDIDILNKMRKILAPKNKFSYYKPENTLHFKVGSTTIYKDLMKLGITANKTFSVKPPKIPKAYLRHYLRGFFDGDGCIHLFKRKDAKKIFPSISIISNISMATFLNTIFNKITGSRLKPYKTLSKYENPMGTLRYTCNNAFKILDFLYEDATIYLNRKNKLYRHIKETMHYANC